MKISQKWFRTQNGLFQVTQIPNIHASFESVSKMLDVKPRHLPNFSKNKKHTWM